MTSLMTKPHAPTTVARRLRRHRWWPLFAVAALLTVVLLLAWVVFWSPLLVVRRVVVDGSSAVSTDRILRVAGLSEGMPLVKVDSDAIQRRLADLDEIATVDVSRSWSGTVTVQIHETKPIAAMRDGDGFVLVATDGTWLRSVPRRPDGLPLVDHGASALDLDPAGRAALQVATAFPPELRRRVDRVLATSASDVTVVLRNGTTVTWGSADESPAKATTLLLLVTSEKGASSYDVAAPSNPSVVR